MLTNHNKERDINNVDKCSCSSPTGIDLANEVSLDTLIKPPNTMNCETKIASPIRQTSRVSLNPARFLTALKESTSAVIKETRAFIESIPIKGPFKVTVITTLGTGLAYLSTLNPVQALGVLAGMSVFAAMSFKDNHHIRAQQAVGQSLFATHLALLGAWPAVLQSGLSAVRCTFLGMLPEETRGLRIAGGVAGFGLATAIFVSFFKIYPLITLNNLPIAVMALTSAAEAFPKKYSGATRTCYLATAALLIPYHLLASGSWMGVVINTIVVGNLLHKKLKYDFNKNTRQSC